MNKYQRLAIIVAVIDVLVMLLFPRSTTARSGHAETLRRLLPDPLRCSTASRSTRPCSASSSCSLAPTRLLPGWCCRPRSITTTFPAFRHEGIGMVRRDQPAADRLLSRPSSLPVAAETSPATFDSFYFIFGDRSKRRFSTCRCCTSK